VTTWQILRDGGLPLAIEPSGVNRTHRELAAAICGAIAEEPSGREAEVLAAYIFAWHHHWPASFASEMGGEAKVVVNRYLKLRRIALENLARIL